MMDKGFPSKFSSNARNSDPVANTATTPVDMFGILLVAQGTPTADKCKNWSLTMTLPEVLGNSFYYFGFGSNMLAKRILIQNKSAVRKGLGKLKDYRLDFHTHTRRWKGAPATIVPTNGSEVYGAIWQIDLANLPDLDRQESVDTGMYTPISVPIETREGITITCRAYHLTNQPSALLDNVDVPHDRQPSKTYLKVLVKGAIETGAPEAYVNCLKAIKHNDNLVDDFEKELELESVELSH